MSFDLNNILRENIKTLVPYSSARDEFKGEAPLSATVVVVEPSLPLLAAYSASLRRLPQAASSIPATRTSAVIGFFTRFPLGAFW